MQKIFTSLRKTWLIAAAAVVMVGGGGLAAVAHASQNGNNGASDGHQNFQAILTPLNGTDAYGVATGTVWRNDWAHFHIVVKNVINAPHAQHIHFGTAAAHECPATSADANGDGIVDTSEGGSAYGPVQTSLTTSGDTSAASTLAVDRFPTYANGTIYDRTFHLTSDQAQAIRSGLSAVVIHGIDTIQKDGKYDGAPMSDLDPSLPQEATAPAACGPFHEVTSLVTSNAVSKQ